MSVSFIDSNVFVYLFDDKHGDKREAAERLVYDSIKTRTGCISFQVINETLNVLCHKLKAKPDDALAVLDHVLLPLCNTMPTPALYRQSLSLQKRFGFHFYDSLIIAAALQAGCIRLYSEDFQHGQRILGLTIHNPFWGTR